MHSYYKSRARGHDAAGGVPPVPGHGRRDRDKKSAPERGKVMGGLQDKLPRVRPSTSSSSSTQHAQGSHTGSTDHPDGQQHCIHPSVARVLGGAEGIVPLQERRDFQSLDRSLKVFLRASNLPGLEYRLRLAGYQTLDDLVDANAEKLFAQGFTRLMAKRLLNALDDYIRRHLDITEGQPSPFQLVRRGHLGQKVKSDPSDEMKALPNFGKQNVKRQSSSDQVSWKQQGRKTSSSSRSSYTPVVRLMSHEQIPSEPIFPNVIDVRDSVFVKEGDSASETSERSITTSSSSSSQMVEIGRMQIRSTSGGREGEEGPAIIPIETTRTSGMFNEFFMDDVDTPTPAPVTDSNHTHHHERERDVVLPFQMSSMHQTTPPGPGYKLRPTCSIPANFWFSSVGGPLPQYPERSYLRVRAYSCPPSLASMETSLEDLLFVLTSAQDVASIISSLKQLLSRVVKGGEKGGGGGEGKGEEGRKGGGGGEGDKMVEAGVMPALVEVLQMEHTCQRVAEQVAVMCCKIIKLLTRQGMVSSMSVPSTMAVAILEAMNYHPTCERLQVEGCLALGNIGRTDHSHCADIVNNGGLQTISHAMGNFSSSVKLQIVAMSALSVVLGAVKEARLLLISDHGHILDVIFQSMQFYPGEVQLQQYACALLSLLIAEVGAQVESGVMQLIVEHTTVAMTTQPNDDHVTTWAAKVFANASENAVFTEHKLTERCTELLVEAMATFLENSEVISWCSYALLRLISGGCGGVVSHVIRGSQLPAYCQTPPTSLSEKAQGYLAQLDEKVQLF